MGRNVHLVVDLLGEGNNVRSSLVLDLVDEKPEEHRQRECQFPNSLKERRVVGRCELDLPSAFLPSFSLFLLRPSALEISRKGSNAQYVFFTRPVQDTELVHEGLDSKRLNVEGRRSSRKGGRERERWWTHGPSSLLQVGSGLDGGSVLRVLLLVLELLGDRGRELGVT